VTLKNLSHLNSNDVTVTLPGATATALLTDSKTQLIQNPELRSVDGQAAKLRVGDRVPVATGSYQTGATATTSSVNALVSTQYQYIDVGVNVDITPHVHPNRDVSMKLAIEVSSVSGYSTIGSLQEPIISQRKIEHEIRLKEGEVSILGGLFERSNTKSKSGWPGISRIPFLGYFTSENDSEVQNNEILIVLIPRVVRYPQFTPGNQRALYTGSETNFQLKLEAGKDDKSASGAVAVSRPAETVKRETAPAPASPIPGSQTTLVFEPRDLTLHAGQSGTLLVTVRQASDLASLAALVEYDPKVVNIEEVHHGTFFSEPGREMAVVQQINNEQGVAVISVQRPVNSRGINGDGPILEIKLRGATQGAGQIRIRNIVGRDSQGQKIALMTTDVTVRVAD